MSDFEWMGTCPRCKKRICIDDGGCWCYEQDDEDDSRLEEGESDPRD